jgi:signal transduction histidine kinase
MKLNKLYFIYVVIILLFCAPNSWASQDSSYSSKALMLVKEARQLSLSQPNLAIKSLDEALEYSEKENDEFLQAEILQLQGQYLINLGNFNLSREKLQKAIVLHTKHQNSEKKAQSAYLIGKTYHAQGYHPGAVKSYLEALRYFESKKDANGLLQCYTALGDVYARMNLFSQSIEYNLKGLKIMENEKDKFRQLVLVENLGTIYQNQKNIPKTKEFLNKALNIYKEIGNKAGEANTLQKLAEIALNQENYIEAKKLYTQSLTIAQKFKAQALMAENLNGLARVNYLLKDYESSSSQYRTAIEISKTAGLNIELDEAYQGLALLYKSLNDQNKSKAFEALSNEIKDSIYNDSILRKTSDLQLLYESEKKQAEIEIYKKNEQLNELSFKKERELRNFFTALSILFLILIGVFIYFTTQNRKINKQLNKQYQELQNKNSAIELQKEQLTQLNDVKDRFFSIISHDLRNSLTTTKLYFDLVSHPDYKSENHPKLTQEISFSVQNTIDLLENLLVWASGQIKGIPIKPVALNMHQLTQENINLVTGSATQKRIQLSNDVDESAIAYGDTDMVNLVLRNLLSNAVKFTPENGFINVLSEEDDNGTIKIMVIDNGVGINSEKAAELFTQYRNTSTKGTGNEKGTGLGLMLCKEFIDKNNGKIWVESEEGNGSVFCFTLPVSKPN